MAAVRLEELEERKRGLAGRRAAAVAAAVSSGPRGGALGRKSVEELARLVEAARLEAEESYRLEGRRVVVRAEPSRGA